VRLALPVEVARRLHRALGETPGEPSSHDTESDPGVPR
jgi:hypothetical protein